MTQVVRTPDGRELSVDSAGDPDGTPVFLLHGTPGSRNGPRPRGIVLYRLGIHLISYDRPGYPGSDRLEGREVADAAVDVEAIAKFFKLDRFSVIGRSGGAPHALACAALLKEQVVCAAALSSLAPYDADDLTWSEGMASSNVQAYEDAASDRKALEATLNEQARQVRNNSEGLLDLLRPELTGHDAKVIGDIALRRLIAEVHAQAVSKTIDGWIDDVIALRGKWHFDLAEITAPVKLWHGSADVFSPPSHTDWLKKKIHTATLDIEPGKAHFGAVEILPKILTWVAQQNHNERHIEAAAADSGSGFPQMSLMSAGPATISARAGAMR